MSWSTNAASSFSALPTSAQGPRQAANGQRPDELTAKAKEFEAILLGQWLQSAESSFGSVPGGDTDDDSGGEQLTSFATQQLAQGISQSGGIGLASLITKGLQREARRNQSATAPK